MSCPNCGGLSTPACDSDPILICVSSALDATVFPAWARAVCVEGVVTEIELFADSDLQTPLVGYTIADRVVCPADLLGTSCATAAKVNLCPETLQAMQGTGESGPNYTMAFTYNANGDVATITRTTANAAYEACEVQTFTYNGLFQLTGISPWVPCV